MTEKIPDKTGENRDEGGRFTPGNSGNPNGRPKGSVSITDRIRKKLAQCPEGKKETWLELLILRILQQAIVEGNETMIKQLWNQVDGMPTQKQQIGGIADEPIYLQLTDGELKSRTKEVEKRIADLEKLAGKKEVKKTGGDKPPGSGNKDPGISTVREDTPKPGDVHGGSNKPGKSDNPTPKKTS